MQKCLWVLPLNRRCIKESNCFVTWANIILWNVQISNPILLKPLDKATSTCWLNLFPYLFIYFILLFTLMTLVFFVSEQCYLYKNEQGQNDIVTTLLPSSAAAGKYYEMFTRIILTFLLDRFYGLFELELRMGCVSIECCNVLANLTTKQKREVLSIILKKVQETLLLWLLVFLFVSGGCPSEDVRVYC